MIKKIYNLNYLDSTTFIMNVDDFLKHPRRCQTLIISNLSLLKVKVVDFFNLPLLEVKLCANQNRKIRASKDGLSDDKYPYSLHISILCG